VCHLRCTEEVENENEEKEEKKEKRIFLKRRAESNAFSLFTFSSVLLNVGCKNH
jgi:hypothetical protein